MATFHPWPSFPIITFFFFFFSLSFTSSLFTFSSSLASNHLHHRHLLESNFLQTIQTFFPSRSSNPPLVPPSSSSHHFGLPSGTSPAFKLQHNSPHNIETFFTSRPVPSNILPSSDSPIINFPSGTASALLSQAPPVSPVLPGPARLPVIPQPLPTKPAASKTVAKAVAGTAASTVVVAGLLFFFLRRFMIARRRRGGQPDKIHKAGMSSFRDESAVSYDAFRLLQGNLKGVVVDENGLDVVYLRKLEGGSNARSGYRKEVLGDQWSGGKRESDRVTESSGDCDRKRFDPSSGKHSLRTLANSRDATVSSSPNGSISKSSDSAPKSLSDSTETGQVLYQFTAEPSISSSHAKLESKVSNGNSHDQSSSSLNNFPQTQSRTGETNMMGCCKPKSSVPIPPPLPPKSAPASSPPPVTEINNIPAAPTPPPAEIKKHPAPPPLPPKASGLKPPPAEIKKNPAPPPPPPKASGLNPPPAPPLTSKGKQIGSTNEEPSSMDGLKETSTGQTKLKPLHWDKVVANPDHSMVWDKIGSGSFRVDDDLMEALFGYVATNRKLANGNKNTETTSSVNLNQPTHIFLLDPRKSQNVAIVLRSLALSRQEILDALLNGTGLSADLLERLTKIAPTKEEEAMILEYSGNPSKLADAESFLYHILKAVPSPFLRLDAMLFKYTYDSEILNLKESLQTLESACKELRSRGLFLKLLEAILKAGNRMNAGTARGNAQAFNLTALRKLSDVKSTDGKTTLLHFVVEEVVMSEGKRCLINRNHSIGQGNNSSSSNTIGKEEREKEYIMLGLPVVGGLSVEFANVKKAAAIDYDNLFSACTTLTMRVKGIHEFLGGQHLGGGDVFVREIKGFLEAAAEELKVVKEEELRVMEVVKKTTEYFQSGASKDQGAHPLQLFIIVKDFLVMVDQACIHIARSHQNKKKSTSGSGGNSPPQVSPKRIPVRFLNLPAHFISDSSKASSSDSESDF